MTTPTETIRKAIDQSGYSLHSLAVECQISYASLHRFYHGQGMLRGDAIDRLAEYFGLELRPKKLSKK